MTLSDDDIDGLYCLECGRLRNDRLERTAEILWIAALLCVIVATVAVVAVCVRALA